MSATEPEILTGAEPIDWEVPSGMAQPLPSADHYLALEIGAARWVVSMADAGEIVAVPPITPVPATPPWLMGLAAVRGALYTVLDLGSLLENRPAGFNKQNRLLTFHPSLGMPLALLVSRLAGLRNFQLAPEGAQTQHGESPAAVEAVRGSAFVDDHGQVWHELKLRALITHEHLWQPAQ